MCGGSKPKVVKTDPAADALKAANEAAAKANKEEATRKKRKADSSLLSSAGGARGDLSGSVLSSGKDTLGS